MAEVTYFVALPFVAADDSIAAGEPTHALRLGATPTRRVRPIRWGITSGSRPKVAAPLPGDAAPPDDRQFFTDAESGIAAR